MKVGLTVRDWHSVALHLEADYPLEAALSQKIAAALSGTHQADQEKLLLLTEGERRRLIQILLLLEEETKRH